MPAVSVIATHAEVDLTPGATTVVTLGTAPTEGSTLVMCAAKYNEGVGLNGVSDNGGGSWALLSTVPDNANYFRIETWVCYDVQAGTTQVTVDYSNQWGGDYPHLIFAELSGIKASSGSAIRHQEAAAPGVSRTVDTDSIDGTTQLTSSVEDYIALCFGIQFDGGGAQSMTGAGGGGGWTKQEEQFHPGNAVASSMWTRIGGTPESPEAITISTAGSRQIDVSMFLMESPGPPVDIPGGDNVLPGFGEALSDIVSWTAGDASAGNAFYNDGNTLLYVRNASGSSKTVTVTGRAAHPTFGYAKDITIAVAANKEQVAGTFDSTAFNNPSTGKVEITMADATGVSFAAIRLPKEA